MALILYLLLLKATGNNANDENQQRNDSCRNHNGTQSEYDHEKVKRKNNTISNRMVELNWSFIMDTTYSFDYSVSPPSTTNDDACFLEVGLPV